MRTQDNLANQEKVVVNGRHCVDTEKSLCTQGNRCVNTTLTDWCTDRFLCVDTGFSCVKADFLSWQKSLVYSLRIFVDNFSLLSPLQRVLAAWFKIFN